MLDSPLAAMIIAGPIVFDFDRDRARVRRRFRRTRGGHSVADWDRAGYPPLLHDYAAVIEPVAVILLPFSLGFDDSTAALLFYEIVGGAGRAARARGASHDVCAGCMKP